MVQTALHIPIFFSRQNYMASGIGAIRLDNRPQVSDKCQSKLFKNRNRAN